jgi:hypothetical protein
VLFTRDAAGKWVPLSASPGSDDSALVLRPWQLPELLGVIVANGPAPLEFCPPVSPNASTGLAIPVVPEVC